MKKWVIRILCASIILIDIIFLIYLRSSNGNRGYSSGIYNILIVTVIAAGLAAVWCLFKSFPNKYELQEITVGMAIAFSLSCLFTAAHCYVYCQFLPKFSVDEAYKTVTEDPVYASELVVIPSPVYSHLIEGNPFVRYGYIFFWESIEYQARSFHIRTSEIQFSQVTGKNRIGHADETVFDIDSLDSFAMDCAYFLKDRKVQINLHLIPKSEYIYHGFETDFFYQGFNLSYDETVKAGINITSRRRPVIAEDDVKAFILDMGEDKLKTLLENCVHSFYTQRNNVAGKDPPEPSSIEIKLYGADIATYQNGSILLKNR